MAEDPKELRRKAQKQVRKGSYDRAIELYEELVDLDPKTARHRLKLADLYARQDRTEEALDAYRAVGKIHADDDIYQKAVAVYKQALRLDAEDPDLQVRLAEAYEGLGRLKDAAKTYRRAGEMFEERGERERQVEMLERLCELDDEDVGIRIQLAETYAKVGRKEDALERFYRTTDVLEEEGRFDEFIQVAERILYFDPDDRQMRKRLIRRYLGRGDNKRALKHLQICYNADKADVETLEMLAEAFDRLDRQSKAKLVLQQLAKLQADRGDRDASKEAWQRILEIDPNDSSARKALEKLGVDPSAPQETPRRQQPPPEESAASSGQTSAQKSDESAGERDLDDIEFLDESPDSDQSEPTSSESVPRDQRDQSDVEELDASALEPVDEEPAQQADKAPPPPGPDNEQSQKDSANPPPTEPPEAEAESRADADSEPVQDLTDHVEPLEEGDRPSREHETSNSEASPNQSQLPQERKFESVEDPELAETLSEVDVFLKYGLYDKVRELLTGVGPQKARSLPVLERRRQMYEHTDEPEAEAGVLLEMARQTDSNQDALRYLSTARQKTDRTDRIDRVADELGIATEEVIEDDRSLPRFESGEMPAVEGPPESDEPAGRESSEADQTAEVEQKESKSSPSDEPDAGPPEFEQPPSNAGEPIEANSPAEADVDDQDTSQPGDVVDVEETGNMAFDEEALEAFDGIEEVDEVDEEAFDEALESGAGVGDANSTAEDAGELFSELDDQFADDLFDSLVMEEGGEEEDVNIGEDDTTGDLAEVDFYIQQGLYDQAEEALDDFEADNPDHEGIEKRRYQIKTARQGAFVRDNPTGAASLSKKFQADVSAEDEEPEDLQRTGNSEGGPKQPDAMNTNIEVGEAYRDMGMYEEAIEEFREAADDPEVAPHARYRIALCEAERGNADQAADELQSLLSDSTLPDELRSAAKSKLNELDAPI